MKTIRIILSIAMIVIIAGCERQQTPVAGTQISAAAPEEPAFQQVKKEKIKPFEFTFKVKDSTEPPTLDNQNDKNMKCIKDWTDDEYRKGCIDAQVNEMANVNFSLIGSPDWYFAEFQICEASNLQKPADFQTCTLTPEQAGEWIILAGRKAAIPDASDHGRVVISNLGQNLSEFTLIDVNLTAATYFYRVCVVENAGDECVVWSDPAAENYGNH